MNLSRIFILRPVATSLLMIAILIAGAVAAGLLPVAALPSVDTPTIQVLTFYPGASPDVMTSSITAPLERQFGQMPGLDRMLSASAAGASMVTLQFNLDLSLDDAEQEVQAAINAAGNLLPGDLPAPPIYAKINPADAPVMTLAVTSKTLALTELENLSETRLAQKISQQPGVGLVSIGGGQRPAVRVKANPRALAALGLNIDDLRTTIANANVNTPKGNFDGPRQASSIDANDQLNSPEDFRRIVVAYRNGAPVRLSDVANVVLSPENSQLAAWADASPAIILEVRRQPGANVIQVADGLKALLPRLEAVLPAGVDVASLSDRTTIVRASIADAEFELMLAVALVVLVIFLFLRNLPATIVPSLSVPLSLVGTLAAMYLMGFSVDNLSLMALTVATGFVVDDAIVMIENISRFVENGVPPLEAALRGSRQIGFTILSLTLSLIAVLIPLLFMGDVVGRLFHEFALTLAVAIAILAAVSLTLVPMLCARLIRHRPKAQLSRFDAVAGRGFDWLARLYGRALARVLDHQPLTLLAALLSLCLALWLAVATPKGFFPAQDTGLIQGISEAAQDVSFAAMAQHQQALALAIMADPDVESLSSSIGVDGTNATLNSGRFLIGLKPHDRRAQSAASIARRLGEAAAHVPGVTLYLQPVQDLTVDSTVSRRPFAFVLADVDAAELRTWAPRLVAALNRRPELAEAASDLEQQGRTVDIAIDRATASRFGITPATVDNALYDAFGQRIVSTIYTRSNQYRVILEADADAQTSLAGLASLHLPSSLGPGKQVPLSAIAEVKQRTGPLQNVRFGQFPATVVSFDAAPGVSLGAAVEAIRQAQQEIGLPRGVSLVFRGTAAAFQASLSNETALLIAAVLTMYIVLGVLYESFIHPITILSILPSAGIGALAGLRLIGNDLDIIAVIGIVLLIGIVKKNAILMVDFALEAERQHGMPPRQAIFEACLLRLRPILMTTLAAMLGALPLLAGSGTGAEIRQPLGAAIVGGLAVSQVLTLFTTPVIYLMFDRLGRHQGPRPIRRGNGLPRGGGGA